MVIVMIRKMSQRPRFFRLSRLYKMLPLRLMEKMMFSLRIAITRMRTRAKREQYKKGGTSSGSGQSSGPKKRYRRTPTVRPMLKGERMWLNRDRGFG
jgi:hypothetical protein